MELSPEQQRRVEELLRRRGLVCPVCGSSALSSTGQAYGTINRRISVQYVCTNREAEHPNPTGFGPWSEPLEPHEARGLGIG